MPSTIKLPYHCIFQIEGAFIQGLGWVALEELKWGDNNHKWIRPGHLFTCGPGAYKIPSVNDIPLNFMVSLLKVNILRIMQMYYVIYIYQDLDKYNIIAGLKQKL